MKKSNVLHWVFIIILLSITACSHDPQPIKYGEDACDFCRMTIVDNQHAAQIVTVKGRNYKYDAIECMINDLSNWERPPVKIQLVADYSRPGILTDAKSANYLISKKIPSPMGANLSAFSQEKNRNEIHQSAGGQKLNWEELILTLSKQHTHNHH